MREAKSANFTIASLLCVLTAVIASLPITGAAFGQESNFVLSSSAFADNGTMSQKYMGKNPANPNAMAQCPCSYTKLSCAIRRVGTVWASSIGSFTALMLLLLHYRRAPAMAKGPA
jgi:hypothetical protein